MSGSELPDHESERGGQGEPRPLCLPSEDRVRLLVEQEVPMDFHLVHTGKLHMLGILMATEASIWH